MNTAEGTGGSRVRLLSIPSPRYLIGRTTHVPGKRPRVLAEGRAGAGPAGEVPGGPGRRPGGGRRRRRGHRRRGRLRLHGPGVRRRRQGRTGPPPRHRRDPRRSTGGVGRRAERRADRESHRWIYYFTLWRGV